MKITFILPHAGLSGGIRVIAIYAERLHQRGHQVLVVSQPLPPITLKQKVKSWLGKSKPYSAPTTSYFDNLNVPYRILDSCRPVTDADVPDADFVVATWWKTAPWVAALAPSKGVKVYFIQHHETHDYFPVDEVAATYRLPLYKIVIAQWLKEVMAECYDDTQVSLVSNSVDLSQFNAPIRSQNPIPRVGMMYSTTSWKGTDISLKAWEIASKSLPNLQLIAFGAEPISADLPLPPGAIYHFRPPQNQIQDIYASCDAWLFGSRLEGFGLPILEAMACRTPVIATPAGAAPELVSQGGGILVPKENPEAMAAAIVQICLLAPSDWLTYSDAAYRTASSYTWDDATDLFEKILESLVPTSP